MAGIDKLQLTTTDFSLQRFDPQLFGLVSHNLQGNTQGLPKLLITKEGQIIEGSKMYRNTDLGQYSINPQGLQVQFNPSKMQHLYHLSGTGKAFDESIKAIKEDLHKSGIGCNLEEMSLSRIDLCNQEQMSHQVGSYLDVFKMFKAKRGNAKEYSSESYSIKTQLWETVGYDKEKQIKENRLQLYYEGEKNLLRIENKWLTKRYIYSNLPFNNLNSLRQVSNEELQAIYKKQLIAKAFCMNRISTQTVLDFKEEGEILNSLMAEHKTKGDAVISYLWNLGDFQFEKIILQFGSMDKFRQFLVDSTGMQRTYSYRIMKKVEQFMNDRIRYSRNKDFTVLNLYDEIIEKFAA
jgi:hypothetical protein